MYNLLRKKYAVNIAILQIAEKICECPNYVKKSKIDFGLHYKSVPEIYARCQK